MSGNTTSTDDKPKLPLPAPTGSAIEDKLKRREAAGVCVLCGSNFLVQYWRGVPENERVHCNACGTEVTPWMHRERQPNPPGKSVKLSSVQIELL